MQLRLLLFITLSVMALSIGAQTFSPAFAGYSRKKPAYITMNDGNEITVYIKSLKFKKGLIDQIKVVSATGKGKKVKVKPEDIISMYLPQSALGQLSQTLDAATDLTKIQDGELSSEHLDDGYLYLESSQVQVKKRKVQGCMVQLMNPTFSKNIKVYNDPWAGETASIGIGGMKLAGGLAKSYYIKKDGEEIARKIKKKEYKKDMDDLFKECKEVLKKHSGDPRWDKFEEFIYDYSTMCK